jgi:hypothetical protein
METLLLFASHIVEHYLYLTDKYSLSRTATIDLRSTSKPCSLRRYEQYSAVSIPEKKFRVTDA